MQQTYACSNKALTGKSGLFFIRHIVLCFLLAACIPLLAEAQNVGLVGVEDVQQTWLDDGTHVVFSHVNNELTFFDRQGQKTAAFRPDEQVSSIWSVYSDGKRIHVLAAAEAGRSVISLENGLVSVIKLPEKSQDSPGEFEVSVGGADVIEPYLENAALGGGEITAIYRSYVKGEEDSGPTEVWPDIYLHSPSIDGSTGVLTMKGSILDWLNRKFGRLISAGAYPALVGRS